MSIARQIELEEQSVVDGSNRYAKRRETYITHGTEDQTKPAQQLMRRTVCAVSEALECDRTAKRKGRSRSALALLEDLESEALAWHGMRVLLVSLTQSAPYAQACVRLGNVLQDELNFRRFSDEERQSYKITQTHIANAPTGGHKRGIMQRMYKLSEINPLSWSQEDLARAGSYVLDLVMRATGWASAVVITKSRNRSIRIIDPSQDLLDWLDQAHEQLALLSPMRMPMVIEPVPWTSPTEGGYLTDHGGALTVIKSHNAGYLEALSMIDMPDVYDALNGIQSTAWKINTGVLRAAKALWDEGICIGTAGKESMPSRHPTDIPVPPTSSPEEFKAWKAGDYPAYQLWAKRAAVVHDANRRMRSKRLSCKMKLELAERFAVKDSIWFPHQMDFRGRVYPVTAYLTPQGDDLSKALLTFAEGKPLTTTGAFWLKVHAANCFGFDKVSFEDRAAWVDEHMDAIIESALDPVDGERFWTTADEPFQALAACAELAGYAVEGPGYVSHLPVSMDGSCNGLQNFSALLRDAVGGTATNLVPSDKPADIYAEVAKLTAEQVRIDAEAGHKYALMFDGFVDRKLVKQPVMTLPYGATRSGMRGQIEAAVKKGGNKMSISTKDMWLACDYVAEVTRTAISQVVVAATQAMDWLQESARLAASEDYPIRWTTPVGLPVLQEYRAPEAQTLRIHVDGQKVKLNIANRGDRLDRRRQAAGISPNLIHSFDAAHMMLTVLLAEANGVTNFAMVHDSYGTHAADVGTLHACIRQAFIQMYDADLLQAFRTEVQAQLPAGVELPELPPMGTLDLNLVAQSAFFFS